MDGGRDRFPGRNLVIRPDPWGVRQATGAVRYDGHLGNDKYPRIAGALSKICWRHGTKGTCCLQFRSLAIGAMTIRLEMVPLPIFNGQKRTELGAGMSMATADWSRVAVFDCKEFDIQVCQCQELGG